MTRAHFISLTTKALAWTAIGAPLAEALASPRMGFSKATLEGARGFLLRKGIDGKYLDSVFSDLRLQKVPRKAIEAAFAKKVKSYEDYEGCFDVDYLTSHGAAFMKKHKPRLDGIWSRLGVSPWLVCATLGIESTYGEVRLQYIAFNGLLTTLEDKPDTEGTLADIHALLLLSGRFGIDLFGIKGSYAGAVGPAQFMPPNLLAYAKREKKKNLQELLSMETAIDMCAKYLKASGATAENWFEKDGSNYKAAFAYNHSEYYATFVCRMAKRIFGETFPVKPLETITPEGLMRNLLPGAFRIGPARVTVPDTSLFH